MMTHDLHPWDRYSGTFGLTQKIEQRSGLLASLDSSLRGIGQIFLINNPLTGIAFVIAVAIHSPWAGMLLLLGAITATATAKVLGYDDSVIRPGLYSFNGALFGVLGAVFLEGEWHLGNAGFSLLAAALSVPIMKVSIEVIVIRFDAPALSATFGVVGGLMLLLVPAAAYTNAHLAIMQPVQRLEQSPVPALRAEIDGPSADLMSGLFQATFRGIGQVVLSDSVLVGVILVLGIALATRIGALMVILGSLSGALAGLAIGADGFQIYHGLWGYNGAVVAVGLFGIVLQPGMRALVATVLAAGASALLYGALQQLMAPYGVIPLSLPLVLVIIACALALRDSRISVIPISEYSTAEQRIRARHHERNAS